jgi:hypothetical protein
MTKLYRGHKELGTQNICTNHQFPSLSGQISPWQSQFSRYRDASTIMAPTRVSLTLDQKRQIQVFIQRNPSIKFFQLSEWASKQFNVVLSSTTAHRIRSAPENAFLSTPGRKKRRPVRFPALEAAVLEFYNLNEGKAILTDDLIVEELDLSGTSKVSQRRTS